MLTESPTHEKRKRAKTKVIKNDSLHCDFCQKKYECEPGNIEGGRLNYLINSAILDGWRNVIDDFACPDCLPKIKVSYADDEKLDIERER